MYSNVSELHLFADKLSCFLSKVRNVFQGTNLENLVNSFVGNADGLYELIKVEMHVSFFGTIDSIGSAIFSDPLSPSEMWWKSASKHMMKYSFFRRIFSGNKDNLDELDEVCFWRFCWLSVVYSFIPKKVSLNPSLKRVRTDAFRVLSISNVMYWSVNLVEIIFNKFFIGALTVILYLMYTFGNSILVPIRVFEPTYLHSLLGSSAASIGTLAVLFFSFRLQKEKVLWKTFFEPTNKTDSLASGILGAILIGCSVFLAASPFINTLTGSKVNDLIGKGEYNEAVSAVQIMYSNDPDKQSYLLSQIYFNAYNETNQYEYKVKGLQQASKYLNSENVQANKIWAVPSVVFEMNSRLVNAEIKIRGYESQNYNLRRYIVWFVFLTGLLLLFVSGFKTFKQ